MLRRMRGFTLLELIVVIVILGILAALAIPTFKAVIGKTEDATTLASLRSFGRDAQALRALELADGWTDEYAETPVQSAGWAVDEIAVRSVAYQFNGDQLVMRTQSPSGKLCTSLVEQGAPVEAQCVDQAPTNPEPSTPSDPKGEEGQQQPVTPAKMAFEEPAAFSGAGKMQRIWATSVGYSVNFGDGGIAPGDKVYLPVTVTNEGGTDGRFTLSATPSLALASSPGVNSAHLLALEIYHLPAAMCSEPGIAGQVPVSTNGVQNPTANASLASGATEDYCVAVRVPDTLDAQDASMSVVMNLR